MMTFDACLADGYDVVRRVTDDARADVVDELARAVAYVRVQGLLADGERVREQVGQRLAACRARYDADVERVETAEKAVREKRSELALFPDAPVGDDARAMRAVSEEMARRIHTRNEFRALADTSKNILHDVEKRLKQVDETLAVLRSVERPALAALPAVVKLVG